MNSDNLPFLTDLSLTNDTIVVDKTMLLTWKYSNNSGAYEKGRCNEFLKNSAVPGNISFASCF